MCEKRNGQMFWDNRLDKVKNSNMRRGKNSPGTKSELYQGKTQQKRPIKIHLQNSPKNPPCHSTCPNACFRHVSMNRLFCHKFGRIVRSAVIRVLTRSQAPSKISCTEAGSSYAASDATEKSGGSSATYCPSNHCILSHQNYTS